MSDLCLDWRHVWLFSVTNLPQNRQRVGQEGWPTEERARVLMCEREKEGVRVREGEREREGGYGQRTLISVWVSSVLRASRLRSLDSVSPSWKCKRAWKQSTEDCKFWFVLLFLDTWCPLDSLSLPSRGLAWASMEMNGRVLPPSIPEDGEAPGDGVQMERNGYRQRLQDGEGGDAEVAVSKSQRRKSDVKVYKEFCDFYARL